MNLFKERKVDRNNNRSIYSVVFKLFEITRYISLNCYIYDAILPFTHERIFLKRSENKSKWLNKYTLSLISIQFAIIIGAGYPLRLLVTFITQYVKGGVRFIKGTMDQTYADFFNFVNFFALIGLLLYLFFH